MTSVSPQRRLTTDQSRHYLLRPQKTCLSAKTSTVSPKKRLSPNTRLSPQTSLSLYEPSRIFSPRSPTSHSEESLLKRDFSDKSLTSFRLVPRHAVIDGGVLCKCGVSDGGMWCVRREWCVTGEVWRGMWSVTGEGSRQSTAEWCERGVCVVSPRESTLYSRAASVHTSYVVCEWRVTAAEVYGHTSPDTQHACPVSGDSDSSNCRDTTRLSCTNRHLCN